MSNLYGINSTNLVLVVKLIIFGYLLSLYFVFLRDFASILYLSTTYILNYLLLLSVLELDWVLLFYILSNILVYSIESSGIYLLLLNSIILIPRPA